MNVCTKHRDNKFPVVALPFQPGPESYTCKGCGNQLGTEAYRRAHHCPCCGEKVTHTCLGTGRGSAHCPHCGRIDSATLHFLPDEDPIAELLAGQMEPPADFTATQCTRQLLGDEIAHFITWSWRDRNYHHGTLAVRGKSMNIRLDTGTRVLEAATGCRSRSCRGQLWHPITAADDLLALHRGEPGRNAVSPCSRCGQPTTTE
ncbi:hypothetical protein OG897_40200 [Streptomyces sp. NBC_00237]|uniref:hypothetical protein n=1 Tax=Streptomyces sp. NBC_00237 TaxID=2975687 RepID=UPI002251B369|nr:hypothetical protein [Streptomyces sp. NBC_00237]MCX5207615.1 hypothetical protein [Streptomyces sp. NBC_00237]